MSQLKRKRSMQRRQPNIRIKNINRRLLSVNSAQKKCIKCGKPNEFENKSNRICSICSDRLLAIKMAREFESARRPTRSKSRKLPEITEKNNVEPKCLNNKINKSSSKDTKNCEILHSNDETCKHHNNTTVLLKKDVNDIQFPCNLGSFHVRSKVLCREFYYAVGDIVSLQKDSNTYYAQIKCIIENQFCEKFAALIWLIPSSSSRPPENGFEPDTYMYGPQDEQFYNVNHMKFQMHAPTKYYKRFINPVPEDTNILHPIKSIMKQRGRR